MPPTNNLQPKTEESLWLKQRRRIRTIALALIGLCTLCLMTGIGLLSLGAFTLPGVIFLVLAVVLLLVGIYLNAASRLLKYTDGTTEWEWERKEREKSQQA